MVPFVSNSTRFPAASSPWTRAARFRCWISGSPPVITTSSTGEDAAQATRSATDRLVDSLRGLNRDQSQVYVVSHRAHVRLHRDRRMNRAGCPQLGPSPWKVGVSTPKHSATISQDPASLAGADGDQAPGDRRLDVLDEPAGQELG